MAFSSQFSLSLELTRLLPLGTALNVVGGAVSKLARELTASGSDIVIEEDVAAVFGRVRICEYFEKTFRATVGSTERTALSKLLDIALESGPGPTVQRALTAPREDYRYLSTVIQLSLLTYVHDVGSLAEQLSLALRNRLDGAPEDHPAAPGYDALFGILRAIREQTNGFRWDFDLDRVFDELGEDYRKAYAKAYPEDSKRHFGTEVKCRAISQSVLQGLSDMFLAVQSLPEDRTVYIETLKGIPTIVVWAHHVLGFNVQVCLFNGDEILERFSFGAGHPQVVIDARHNPDSTRTGISLLATADSSVLFHLTTDENDSGTRLEASQRRPLRGFAARLLSSIIKTQRLRIDPEEQDRLLRTIALDAVAVGIVSFLPGNPPPAVYADSVDKLRETLDNSPYRDLVRVERSVSVIFGVLPHEFERDVQRVVSKTRQKSRYEGHMSTYTTSGPKALKINIEPLLVLVRACCCIRDIEECIDLLIPESFGFEVPQGCSAVTQVQPQQGKASQGSHTRANWWDDKSLMELFAVVLFGKGFRQEEGKSSLSFKKAGLISEGGWSVFLPTVDIVDPIEVNAYEILIRRGVPIRDGVRRRRIEDGSLATTYPKGAGRFVQVLEGGSRTPTAEGNRELLNSQTEAIDLLYQDHSGAAFTASRVGITSSAFIVSFCIDGKSWGKAETGIRAMYKDGNPLKTRRLRPCCHSTNIQDALEHAELPAAVYYLEGPDSLLGDSVSTGRYPAARMRGYFLLPTSGNVAARWLAVCLGGTHASLSLCHRHTCLQCVLASLEAGLFMPKSVIL